MGENTHEHNAGPHAGERATVPLPPMAPASWGVAAEARPLSEDVRALVAELLGLPAEGTPAGGAHIPAPRPTRLAEADLAALGGIVGAGNVTVDDEQRLRRARGKSTPDLLAWRHDPDAPAPDAVVAPRGEDDVVALLDWCGRQGVAVVPFGGGTSVVGGLDAEADASAGGHRAVVSLDLAHLDGLTDLDPVSGEATLGAGVTGPRAEELLRAHGFSLGHFPQSFRYATVGGFAMTRSSGQNSAGYGRFDEMVRGLTVVTPAGVMRAGRAPASAAGPDLRQLLLGSEGAFGVCTSVRLRVHPVPEVVEHEAFTFPDFATGAAALRAVEQTGAGPTVIRLSDETETGVNLAMGEKIGSTGDAAPGCLCVTMYEGTAGQVRAAHERTREVLLAHGGESLGARPAEEWEHGRFGAPALRDALLDAGALCETLETATDWSSLGALRDTVVATLTAELEATGTPALVMCHISHVYPTGASLYFTVVAGQRGSDPAAQWRGVKRATTAAIQAAGGTVTHHHAVGRDHREFMTEEIGAPGVAVLRAVKRTLDPHGVCNPGVLIP